MGGSGAGRGTLAHRVCLGFPPSNLSCATAWAQRASRFPPLGGGQEQSSGTKSTKWDVLLQKSPKYCAQHLVQLGGNPYPIFQDRMAHQNNHLPRAKLARQSAVRSTGAQH